MENNLNILPARDSKTDARTKSTPVVILTSSKKDPDTKECYSLGVNGYMVKPVKSGEFHKVISDSCLYWIIVNQPPQWTIT